MMKCWIDLIKTISMQIHLTWEIRAMECTISKRMELIYSRMPNFPEDLNILSIDEYEEAAGTVNAEKSWTFPKKSWTSTQKIGHFPKKLDIIPKKLDISQKYVRHYLKYALLFKIIFYNKIEFCTLPRRSRRSSIVYRILRGRLPHPQPIPIKHALNPIRK